MANEFEQIKTKPRSDLEPVLVDAARAAAMLNLSVSMFYRLLSSGRIGPKPIHIGPRCTRFVVADLKRWAESGCIPREQWMKEMSK